MWFTKEKYDFIDLSSKQSKFMNESIKIKKIGNLKDDKIAYYSFIFFIIIACYICSIFIGSALELIIGLPVESYEFFLFPIIAMIICMAVLKMEKEKAYIYLPIIALIVYFLLCFLLAYINKQVWDYSTDSLSYHEPMIINLFHGWNPVYNPTFNHRANIWDLHYPKAAAIYGTMIYKITGKIAGAKLLSSLIPIVTSGIVFSFVKVMLRRKKNIFSTIMALIASFLLLINPINIEQFLSFDVDSILGGLIIVLSIVVLYIVIFKDLNKFKYVSLGFIIPFLSNVKFTGLTYSIAILGAMLLFYFFFGDKKEIKDNFIFLFWMFIFTFCIVGFNPYITNIISNGNPFYPLMGKGHTNILLPNTPTAMRDKSAFIQNLYSLVANANMSNIYTGAPSTSIKELLAFNSSVAQYYSYVAPTARGFGILSFLIEPISILALIFIFIKERKRKNKHFYFIILFLCIGILLMALQAGGYWWARYIPYFWLVPVMVSIILISYRNYIVKCLGILLIVLMICNTAIFIPAFKYKQHISNEYKSMVFSKDSPKTIVEGLLSTPTLENRFDEYGINYKLIKENK